MNDAVECRLFVYGTLAPGRSNAHILAGLEGEWEKASTRGRMCPEGWGATNGYPALILDDGADGEDVQGFLLTSTGLPAFWPELDDFEGADYLREIANVLTESGVKTTAYTYVLNQGK
jgi:gamma-glutamylcyclotransferase (GGCT)/AIG2-like uncharacterized protein YtfP